MPLKALVSRFRFDGDGGQQYGGAGHGRRLLLFFEPGAGRRRESGAQDFRRGRGKLYEALLGEFASLQISAQFVEQLSNTIRRARQARREIGERAL